MREFTEFEKLLKREQLKLFWFSRLTISKTMVEFEKQNKITSSKSTSRTTSVETHCGEKNHRTAAFLVTAKSNQHLISSVSTKTVHCELNKARYHERSAIKKTLSQQKIKNRLDWYWDDKGGRQINGSKKYSLTRPPFPFFLLQNEFTCGGSNRN